MKFLKQIGVAVFLLSLVSPAFAQDNGSNMGTGNTSSTSDIGTTQTSGTSTGTSEYSSDAMSNARDYDKAKPSANKRKSRKTHSYSRNHPDPNATTQQNR
jgi:hypothetical protein